VRRLAILQRYNVSCLLIDRRSELFDKNVTSTFGPLAKSVPDRADADWKFIFLGKSPAELQNE
jgi:hypothetical protein